MMRRGPLLAFLSAGLLILAASAADAQELNNIVETYQAASRTWFDRSQIIVEGLYRRLLLIEIAMSLIGWGLLHISGKLTGGGLVASFFQKLMVLGLCAVAFQSYPIFAPR